MYFMMVFAVRFHGGGGLGCLLVVLLDVCLLVFWRDFMETDRVGVEASS